MSLPEQPSSDKSSSSDERPLTLILDMQKYLDQLEAMDATLEQKEEYILAWWTLLLNFAELGFEIHPYQDALKAKAACSKRPAGKTSKAQENIRLLAPDMLYLGQSKRTQIINQSGYAHEPENRKESP